RDQGMHDLGTAEAGADLAPGPQASPGGHPRLLAGVDMQPPQADPPAAVLEHRLQLPARALEQFAVDDLAFEDHMLSRARLCDGRDAGLVLVTQGQMDDEIHRLAQAELVELALQRGRPVRRRAGGTGLAGAGGGVQAAPRGRGWPRSRTGRPWAGWPPR